MLELLIWDKRNNNNNPTIRMCVLLQSFPFLYRTCFSVAKPAIFHINSGKKAKMLRYLAVSSFFLIASPYSSASFILSITKILTTLISLSLYPTAVLLLFSLSFCLADQFVIFLLALVNQFAIFSCSNLVLWAGKCSSCPLLIFPWTHGTAADGLPWPGRPACCSLSLVLTLSLFHWVGLYTCVCVRVYLSESAQPHKAKILPLFLACVYMCMHVCVCVLLSLPRFLVQRYLWLCTSVCARIHTCK